jgi:glycosyltransferase involved in cell wall biosynthesis
MIKVKYIGGNIFGDYRKVFGGTPMTIDCYLKAFHNDSEYEIEAIARQSFAKDFKVRYLAYIKDADIVHVDDTSMLGKIYVNGLPVPDVIGVVARSPVKEYKGWHCPYPEEWFYGAKVIRLNYSEERQCKDRVTLIRHGIDTDMLHPDYTRIPERKYILWAGNAKRYAKNYEMMHAIKTQSRLPHPFEFKILTQYHVKDYWDILDQTFLLINTSRYESFCCALFEAKAKGIPTIYKENLHGDNLHAHSGIQVPYDVHSYIDKIHEVIEETQRDSGYYQALSHQSRQTVLDHHSLKNMRDDIARVYDTVK